MKKKLFLNISFLVLLSFPVISSEYVIRNAKIHTPSSLYIEGGDIHVKDGVFVEISTNLKLRGIKEIDAMGRYITPGFLAPLSQIGLIEIELEPNTRDDISIYYSSGFSISDAFNPSSSLVPYNLRGGITTSLSSPSLSRHLFSGLMSAFHLTGSLEESLIRSDIALIARMGGAEDSRAATILMIEDSFIQAKDFMKTDSPQEHIKPNKLLFSKRDLMAITRVLKKEIPLVVNANRASDILALINLSKTQDINLVISGAKEGWRVAERLKEANIPVIIQPIDNLPSSFDEIGASIENASRLHEAGVKILISSHESHNAYLSRQGAGIAVSYGLPWNVAIDALSKNIAETFALDYLGSIEVGKSADFIIWDQDPLEVSAFADRIFISGEEVALTTRSSKLRDRYIKK